MKAGHIPPTLKLVLFHTQPHMDTATDMAWHITLGLITDTVTSIATGMAAVITIAKRMDIVTNMFFWTGIVTVAMIPVLNILMLAQ